ncbi:DUF421 domain-containing protein [Bacillus sp. FJAT-29937]|uniref:DUF421 domain-containing protein n=1 Tax=Bacillus sp. FJAT-29937 TaxID=1720553 RepID=UPI00083223D5|nr:DUF421 domain-containing protein [Bacillus sp. FJAT-29937]
MSEWSHIIIRTFIFLFVLFIITKILGKKHISQITFFEYVAGITIGDIAGNLITGLDIKIGHGILGIGLIGIVTFAVGYIALKSNSFRDFVEGKGTIFIKDGKIMEDNLKKEKYSSDELTYLLRKKDVFNLADVEFAVLEHTGDLSVLLKKENRPLTPKDINLITPDEKVPQTVIRDGSIVHDSLASAGKNRKWLMDELDKLEVTMDNVFYGQVDSYGDLTIDLYDDKIKQPSPQTRPLLMALLKKCQADLELFELETDAPDAKKMYKKNAKKLNEAIRILNPYLNN